MEESYRYLINIGSIGQPRDGNPKASFGIWNEETGTVTIRRIEYDLEATQRKMLKAGLPEYLAQRLAMGR
jgi:diadenosine tetraphosphatase ApaH/serine/threonine PP2A family protein phosphatase